MTSDDEKIQLEHEAARLFMRQYEERFHCQMRHIWHNRPAKPDVSCYLNGERLDLEIAHLYGSELEAMQILGRSLHQDTQHALQQLQTMPAVERLIAGLNRIIWQKSRKFYQSERVWLVIRNANPLWQAADFLTHRQLLQLPRHHVFEQIWLVADFQGKTGILRLDAETEEYLC